MLTHLSTAIGAPLVGNSEAKGRTAVLNAWSVLMSETWRYFHRMSSLHVRTAYTTGTVSFDATTLVVTLTGGTFPANTTDRFIRLSNVWYPVSQRLSDTTLKLEEEQCPPAALTDVTYHLQQLLYPLPVEVGEIVQIVDSRRPLQLAPLELLTAHSIHTLAGLTMMTQAYTLIASPRYPGRYCLWVPTLISEDVVLQYMYVQRRPANVLVKEVTGTVSTVAAGVVSFSDEVVTSLWEGACLRISRNEEVPTGAFGDDQTGDNIYNPNCHEVQVMEVLTSQTCRINDVTITIGTEEAPAEAPYVASSHIDVKGGAMSEYLQRLVEDQYGVRPVANHTEGLTSHRRVVQANLRAHEEDGQGFRNAPSCLSGWYRLRLSDFTSGVSY
jgi:hypothetical protein